MVSGCYTPGNHESRLELVYGMSVFDLNRFIEAQAPVIDQVRRELVSGRKRTHWMWFIFPQLRGLGRSQTAQYFGLTGAAEARAYLADPILGPRLVECTTAYEVFSSPDDLKFRSCMTLFATLQPSPFEDALRKYFNAEPDPKTLELLNAA